LLEATSGNTGIGLAMICSIYQIPLIIVMSKSATKERFLQMKCLGAKLILVHGDTKKAKLVCDALRKRCKNIIYVNQFQNEMNARAHYETTAQEIAKEKTFDEILVGLGSGGTYRGLYDFFLSTRTKVISVEKANPIPGLGYDEDNIFLNGINDSTREKIEVDYKESYFFFQELAKLEGLFVGISSGSVCSAGVKKLKKEAKDILLIFPDSGTRYFSLIESENT
jgi:cysteine synthase